MPRWRHTAPGVGEAVFTPYRFEPREVEDRAVPSRSAPLSFQRQRSCKHADVTQEYSLWTRCEATWHDVTWRNSVDWLRFSAAVSGYISEAVSSFSSVLRSEFAESVLGEFLRRSSTSKFSVGNRYGMPYVKKMQRVNWIFIWSVLWRLWENRVDYWRARIVSCVNVTQRNKWL
jgi:hypothetical protein